MFLAIFGFGYSTSDPPRRVCSVRSTDDAGADPLRSRNHHRCGVSRRLQVPVRHRRLPCHCVGEGNLEHFKSWFNKRFCDSCWGYSQWIAAVYIALYLLLRQLAKVDIRGVCKLAYAIRMLQYDACVDAIAVPRETGKKINV